jgi:hypothetical protein
MNRTMNQQSLFAPPPAGRGGANSSTHQAQAIMQLDYNLKNGYFPQIQLLDELHEEYPNSTFIMNFRPIQDWIKSTTNWYGLKYRFGLMNIPGLIQNEKQREYNNIERERYYNQIEKEEHPQLNNRERQKKRQKRKERIEMNKKRTEKKILLLNNNNNNNNNATTNTKKLKWHKNNNSSTSLRPRRIPSSSRRKLTGIEKDDTHLEYDYMLTDIQMARWWCNHVQHIREYTSQKYGGYTSHTLIELDLYNTNETSQLLYDLFVNNNNRATPPPQNNVKGDVSVSSENNNNNNNKNDNDPKYSCWGHKNKNIKNNKDINNNNTAAAAAAAASSASNDNNENDDVNDDENENDDDDDDLR